MVSFLVRALRDHRLDSVLPEPVTDAGIAVSLVTGKATRTGAPTNPHRIHQPFELRRLVSLSGGDFRGKGQTSAVSNQVQLAAESASRAAQSVVFGLLFAPFLPPPAAARLARIDEPSTHQRSQSIFPSASSRIWSCSRIRSNRPSRCQRPKRSYTVCQGPYRSGRSRQGAPVRSTQTIPFRIVRWSFHGQPRCPLFEGSRSQINSHCASVSSYRRIRAVSQAGADLLSATILGYRHFDHLSDRT